MRLDERRVMAELKLKRVFCVFAADQVIRSPQAGEAAIAKGKADNTNTSAFEKCVADMKAGKI